MVQNENLPIVGVIGATGKQGHSVVRTLIESGQYRVRALTRTPGTNKAKEWMKYYTGLGQDKKALMDADLVVFDATKENTFEKAFTGLDYLYAMTQPSDDTNQEYESGKRIADWAKKAGIKHVIWSSLPNVAEISKNELNVPHFTNKARVEKYMKEISLPYTAVVPGFFLQNVTDNDMFKLQKLGSTEDRVLRLPLSKDRKVPVCDPTEETGPAVLKILNHRDDMVGKESPIYSEELSMGEIVNMIDENAKYEQVSAEEIKRTPLSERQPKIPDEYIDMFVFFEKYGYFGGLRSSAGAKSHAKDGGSKAKEFFSKHKQRLNEKMAN